MNTKYLIGLLLAVVLIGLGIWYISGQSGTSTDNSAAVATTGDSMDGMDMGSSTDMSDATSTDTTAGVSVDATTGTTKEFTVTGSNFAFTPTTLTVNKGDHVKITFKNSGGFHDIVIDEFNVKSARINGGDSVTVEFDATKTGSFEYYCSVGNHRAMGMKGTLVVK